MSNRKTIARSGGTFRSLRLPEQVPNDGFLTFRRDVQPGEGPDEGQMGPLKLRILLPQLASFSSAAAWPVVARSRSILGRSALSTRTVTVEEETSAYPEWTAKRVFV